MKDNDIELEFYIGNSKEIKEETPEVISELSGEDAMEYEALSNSDPDSVGEYEKKERGMIGKIKSVKRWWKNRKRWQKAVLISVTSVVLAVSIGLSFVFSYFDYNYNPITTKPEELGFEGTIDKNVINIALFGIDTRKQNYFKGNSDSIMILSLNTKLKKVKIISVMRDSLVPVEQDGETRYKKINSAYSLGGPVLAIKTLNKVFGLDISEYATVNFYGMMDIIDAVGGIEAELIDREVVSAGANRHALNGLIKEMCKKLKKDPEKYYITEPGKYKLNGIQAVAYSRIRYVPNVWGTNNDYGRTDRQRYVMNQLFNRAVKISKSEYPKLIKALIPCSETSLSYSDIMGLAVNLLLNSPTFEETRMPKNEYQMTQPNTSEGSVVYYDIDFAKKVVNAFIYDDISLEDYVEQNGIEKNDWYRNRFGISSGGTSSSGQWTSGGNSSKTDNTPSKPSASKPEKDEKDESKPESTQSVQSSSTDSSSGKESSDGQTSSITHEETDNSSEQGTSSVPQGGSETGGSSVTETPSVPESSTPEESSSSEPTSSIESSSSAESGSSSENGTDSDSSGSQAPQTPTE